MKDAIFDISLDVNNNDLTTAQSILSNSMSDGHALILQYADPLERLLFGALKMESQQAVITTEFNIVKVGNRVLGIWVRSPEPFNDPKMPDNELANTIQAAFNGGNVNQHKVLFSKDRSSAFLTNGNNIMNLSTGDYRFTFRYKQYNGMNYVEKAVVNNVPVSI